MRDFPSPRGKWRISENGGWDPKWSADGNALYYLSGDSVIIRTDLDVGAGVSATGSEVAWRLDALTSGWELDPATGRAVVTAPMESNVGIDDVKTWIVVNWFEELRRLTGGG